MTAKKKAKEGTPVGATQPKAETNVDNGLSFSPNDGNIPKEIKAALPNATPESAQVLKELGATVQEGGKDGVLVGKEGQRFLVVPLTTTTEVTTPPPAMMGMKKRISLVLQRLVG